MREAVAKRVEELKALKGESGPDDYQCAAVVEAAHLDAVVDFAVKLSEKAGLPAPRLYPTEGGGVSAEWSLPYWELRAESRRSSSIVMFRVWRVKLQPPKEQQVELSLDLAHVASIECAAGLIFAHDMTGE